MFDKWLLVRYNINEREVDNIMTELHLMVAMFERCGHKVDIIPDPCGFWVEVENACHQRVRFIFNQKAEYCGICPLEL